MCEEYDKYFTCESSSSDSDKVVKKCLPTQTRVREQLGSRLTDVFFDNLDSQARVWLGLDPPLVGPDTVWVSPDARLEQKVFVTPIPEPTVLHQKAFLHESILEVGQKYISMLENQYKLEKEAALAAQAEKLEELCRKRIIQAKEENFIEDDSCRKVVATLMEHFDNCFEDVVKTTQLRVRKECQLRIEEERAELAAYMLTLVQEQVEKRDLELCNDFHDILYNELNILASRYVKQINEERAIATQLIQETVQKYEKMLQELKMEMEFCAVVDICRAITKERSQCYLRVKKIKEEFKNKQDELMAFINDLRSTNFTLQKMSTERLKRLMHWREKVRIILQEFQRFINFALKDCPGQSEFLLHPEQLMLPKHPEDSFLYPEDYEHFKSCVKDKPLPPEPEVTHEDNLLEFRAAKPQNSLSLLDSRDFAHSIAYQEKTVNIFNFDYYKLKPFLRRRLVSAPPKPRPSRKTKKAVCIWKKKSPEGSIDKSSELQQMLHLVGEKEKEHLVPVNIFIKKRLSIILKVCQDDPEFAKIILGHPEVKKLGKEENLACQRVIPSWN